MNPEIILGWPEWTIIVMWTLVLLVSFAKNGEPKGEWDFVGVAMMMVIYAFILYFGGFWT